MHVAKFAFCYRLTSNNLCSGEIIYDFRSYFFFVRFQALVLHIIRIFVVMIEVGKEEITMYAAYFVN